MCRLSRSSFKHGEAWLSSHRPHLILAQDRERPLMSKVLLVRQLDLNLLEGREKHENMLTGMMPQISRDQVEHNIVTKLTTLSRVWSRGLRLMMCRVWNQCKRNDALSRVRKDE
eukprot:Selendium_serpulae@DN6139_c3_g4_i2.p2